MDTAAHIDLLREHSERFAALLVEATDGGRLGTTVPTCPDWSVRDLAEHLGGVGRWAAHLVEQGVDVETWRASVPVTYPGESDADVAPWFAAGIGPMTAAFAAAPPDRRVWGWGADQHARFWPRRVLHETLIHGADLALTLGHEPEIPAEAAVDGIDEFLTNLPLTARWGMPLDWFRGDGERLVVRASDTGDTWRIRFHRTGMWWDRGADPADATLAGPVADLYLRLQGRARPTVVAEGDDALVDHWFTGLQF